MIKNLGLYIHIPFCVKKCDYCDFLSASANEATKRSYMEALLKEIRGYHGRMAEYRVRTIFIGGGTPSCIDGSYIHLIMDTVREVFTVVQPEVTIEINPGTVDRDKLQLYREAGINRLSFGLQSAKDNELRLLGRIHTYEQFVKNYFLARDIGFHNINIDLISALPGQTVEAWEDTLNQVIDLGPEHISAYSLIIEEGTPFYDRYGKADISDESDQLPDDECDRLIYQRTKDILKAAGYRRYEISNYAREGYECRHNISYWNGTEYLGLGLGSSSLIQNTRFHNEAVLEEYLSNSNPLGIRREIINLDSKAQMEEFMFLGLRMTEGISRKNFYARFGRDIETVYRDAIKEALMEGLLMESGDRISLTERGIDVSNVVLSRFLLD